MTDLGSRSDLEALRRSGRGKVVTLVVVLAVALGAAGWYFLARSQGTGNPEDPAKVLIVAQSRGLGIRLDELGFEVAEGTFEAWEHKADEEVPDLESTGVEAIMALADRFGYGYVVFEEPQGLDLSGLDVQEVPPMPEHVRFGVLSVGDLAFPHVMTVNPEPSEVLRGASVVMLQALFEQERLAELLPDREGSSIAAIQLRDRLRDAVDKLARVPEAEKMVTKILGQIHERLEEEERAEPKPAVVGEVLHSGTAAPLANGQILTIGRTFQVVTRDAVRASLALENEERLRVGAPGAAADQRVSCDALAGGAVSVHESAQFTVAADGSAILIKTLADGLTLWTLDAERPGCGFASAGTIPAPASGISSPVPAGHGQVARSGLAGDRGVISVVSAGQDDELLLGMIELTGFESVAWLSPRFLIAVGEGAEGTALYLFDRQTPLSVLRLPSSMFESPEALHEVAVGRRGERPVIVVSAASDLLRKVYRLELPSDLSELFAAPPVDEAEVSLMVERTRSRQAEGLPVITPLDPNRFVVTALTHEGRARDLHVSADGSVVAFSLRGDTFDPAAPGDAEIAVVPATGGALKILTRNALRDRRPRLTPDGGHVTFETRLEIPKTDWVVTSPRVAVVPR